MFFNSAPSLTDEKGEHDDTFLSSNHHDIPAGFQIKARDQRRTVLTTPRGQPPGPRGPTAKTLPQVPVRVSGRLDVASAESVHFLEAIPQANGGSALLIWVSSRQKEQLTAADSVLLNGCKSAKPVISVLLGEGWHSMAVHVYRVAYHWTRRECPASC